MHLGFIPSVCFLLMRKVLGCYGGVLLNPPQLWRNSNYILESRQSQAETLKDFLQIPQLLRRKVSQTSVSSEIQLSPNLAPCSFSQKPNSNFNEMNSLVLLPHVSQRMLGALIRILRNVEALLSSTPRAKLRSRPGVQEGGPRAPSTLKQWPLSPAPTSGPPPLPPPPSGPASEPRMHLDENKIPRDWP